MQIRIQHINYESKDYEALLVLRQHILRAPLGLNLYDEPLEQEKEQHIFAAKFGNEIVGCVILQPLENNTCKLRQMAVEPAFQKKKLGTALIKYAEQFAKAHFFNTINLHARANVVTFYEKLGYEKSENVFTEVGIPHVEMYKNL